MTCPEERDETGRSDAMTMRLLKTRTVLISGSVDQEMADHVIAQLMVLDGESHEPIRVILTTPGGVIYSGYAVYDIMRYIESPIIAIGAGYVASMGVPILLGADKDPGDDSEPIPVHFASGVLDVTDRGGTFHLKDNSRLWQGQRLLLADEVIYRQSDGVVDASGHVRTTLPAREVDASAVADADVMVVARSLHFSRRENRANYVGNVRYSDPGHTLSANELVILFDDDNQVTGVEATGAVEMVDLASGRKMTGMMARRDIDSQTVRVTGSPVQLTDASGSMVSGSSLTWDQASGRVTMAGGTETIYYPEELP